MRTAANKIEQAGAGLVLIGNGARAQGVEFLRETEADIRLLVDPGLDGYRAASLERSLLAPYSPRGWFEAVRSFLRGFKPGRVAGDTYQLGGTFVVTPEQRVEYSFVSQSIYARAPIGEILATLERLAGGAVEPAGS